MKRVFAALYIWLLVSLLTGAGAQASPVDGGTTGKAPTVTQLKEVAPIQTIKMPNLKPIATLDLHPYPYMPMGTYANSYDPGQCTWGAASMKGDIPSNWGNADTWAYFARLDGYTVSSTPILGAVGATSIGWAGHVVVVTGINSDGTITITEMNYDGYGDGAWRTRVADPSEFVYIYI